VSLLLNDMLLASSRTRVDSDFHALAARALTSALRRGADPWRALQLLALLTAALDDEILARSLLAIYVTSGRPAAPCFRQSYARILRPDRAAVAPVPRRLSVALRLTDSTRRNTPLLPRGRS
jgi:hypothetical protein